MENVYVASERLSVGVACVCDVFASVKPWSVRFCTKPAWSECAVVSASGVEPIGCQPVMFELAPVMLKSLEMLVAFWVVAPSKITSNPPRLLGFVLCVTVNWRVTLNVPPADAVCDVGVAVNDIVASADCARNPAAAHMTSMVFFIVMLSIAFTSIAF